MPAYLQTELLALRLQLPLRGAPLAAPRWIRQRARTIPRPLLVAKRDTSPRAGVVSEPASHLHERVVHHRVAQEVADHEPPQRQAPGQRVSTHCDDVESRFLMVRIVSVPADRLFTSATEIGAADLWKEWRGDIGPRELRGCFVLSRPHFMTQGLQFRIQKCSVRGQSAIDASTRFDALEKLVDLVAQLSLHSANREAFTSIEQCC